MLTKTRLSSLVSAACDEAKQGTTYNALLALVGDANSEWLYGWLNAQRRCRPPVLVQRADGSYIRPQYLPPPPVDVPPVVRADVLRKAACARWQKVREKRDESATHKRCARGNHVVPVAEFALHGKDPQGRPRLSSNCKACEAARKREWARKRGGWR